MGPCSQRRSSCSREFTDPEAAAWIVVADVGLASADVDLSELADSVRRGRVYAGYSGWGAGQLESEMEVDSWIVEPPLPAELFPEDPGDSLERRPRAQGWAVLADREDARGSVAELSRAPCPALRTITGVMETRPRPPS